MKKTFTDPDFYLSMFYMFCFYIYGEGVMYFIKDMPNGNISVYMIYQMFTLAIVVGLYFRFKKKR